MLFDPPPSANRKPFENNSDTIKKGSVKEWGLFCIFAIRNRYSYIEARPAEFPGRTLLSPACRQGGEVSPDEATFVDGIKRVFPLVSLRVQGKVDHHDRVFLDDPDQHDNAHHGVEVEVRFENQECHQSPKSGGCKP